MTYPNFKNKHIEESLIEPKQFMLEYKRYKKSDFPKKYIFVYSESPIRYLKKKYKGRYKIIKLYKDHAIYVYNNVGLIRMGGVGAPHATIFLEEIIAMGGKEFLSLGTAGGLQEEGIFLCNKAIRDEGTSSHYIAHEKYSYPNKELTKRLESNLNKAKIKYKKGTTWTIDAPYRETKAEITHYKKEGVATVEMEASALFAVAKLRKVKIASAFVVSDVLGKKWEPKFHHINVKKSLNKLIDVGIECLK